MNNGSKNGASAPQMPQFGMGGRRGPMNARLKVEKPKSTKGAIVKLIKYLGKSQTLLFTMLILMVIITLCELAGPLFQGYAINSIETVTYNSENDEIIMNPNSDEVKDYIKSNDIDTYKKLKVHWHSENYSGKDGSTIGLLNCLIIMGCIFLSNALLTLFREFIAANLSQKTIYVMRNDLFKKISKLPIKYTDRHSHGDIMSRMTNDIENVSNAISQSIASLFSSVTTLLGSFILMMTISPLLTLIACVTIPLTIFVSTMLAKFMRKYFVRQQKLLGKINGQVEETVTSYQTVVSYGKEQESVEKFAETSEQLRKTSISARVWGSIMGPCMNFLGNLQYVLIAAVGGFMILNGAAISVGNIQQMLQYSKKFTRPINEIANQYSTILTALAGAERIFDIIGTPDELDEGKSEIKPEDIKGNIEFKDIDFGYVPGEPVLKKFNLSVKAGQKIAIVGATGSGKTTVVNLLTRFYEINEGQITIDGIDVRDIPKAKLRKMIAIVLQDTVLFCDSIKTNIKYGNLEADDDEIRKAAASAKADTFIERLPDGYDTMLTEAGSNLSQGQRQLLSIARAVLAEPKILILDEATSSVDTRTEMHIQQAMLELMKNRTSLIIAHRLSTIRDADMIVVLQGGHVAEAGNHNELLALKGEYFNLYSNQFAGIET